MGDPLFSLQTLKKHPAVSKNENSLHLILIRDEAKKYIFVHFDSGEEEKEKKCLIDFVETYRGLYNQKGYTVTIVSKLQLC